MTVTGGATATLSVAVATDAGTDAGSGVDTGSLVVERQEADLDNGDGTCDAFGSWTTVTLTAGADTGVVSGKCYRYRVRSSDLVGNEATSAASATVQVDTAAPGVTLDDPGANLAGTVTLSATATDAASGIASVVFQRSPADAGTWTTITGSWDTTGVADGLYDLRAIATDAAGNTTTSADRRGPARRQRQPRHDDRLGARPIPTTTRRPPSSSARPSPARPSSAASTAAPGARARRR